MTARPLRRRARAFTLVEVLVAIAVLAMISTLIYAAFAGLSRSKAGVARLNERHHEGRVALLRMAREIESAYVSQHVPIDPSQLVKSSAFVLKPGSPGARLDFDTFAHRALDRDAHESDQADISYFASEDPEHRGVVDLARRVQPRPDAEPGKGGRVEVLATDIVAFEVEVLDPMTGEWTDSWDTTQAIGQPGRLPLMVRLALVLKGVRRNTADSPRQNITYRTSVALAMHRALTFATQ